MVFKVLAVVALVVLPLNIVLWHRSHKEPTRYRWDLTEYKSIDVYLRQGVCGLYVLSMPTLTRVKSEFAGALRFSALPNNTSLLLSSTRRGDFRHTWLVFPFWLPAVLLTVCGAVPIAKGPILRWWRARRGRCTYCGYDLRGSRSGACPECGLRY